MSMIMYVARGTVRELERQAESGGDDGSLPPAFERLLSRQQELFARLTPESRAQAAAVLQAYPQLRAVMPQLVERLEGRPTIVPRSDETDESDGAGGPATATATPEPETIDIHKSWHVLHFLFTGREAEGGTPPANFLLEGGREVGEDMGYGPAYLLSPAETAAVARFLGGLTVADLTRRIDAPRMAALGIYCAGEGSRADAEEMAEDVELYFPQLQAHFQAAAQAGQATLVWLS
jgi:hypothetical protein